MLHRLLKGIHWRIVSVAAGLVLIGVVAIYSASFRMGGGFAAKQATWTLIAVCAFFSAAWVGYRFFLNVSYLFYGLTIVLLVFVPLFGETYLGANRWISFGPFQLQPSELCKIATILILAQYLANRTALSEQKRSFFVTLALVAVPVGLILKQPDLGSALVFLPVLFAILFFWGFRIRYLVFLAMLGISMAPFLWHTLKPYQQKRLLVFFNPSVDPIGASYTAIQSKIAVGSGGLIGKGWLRGTQTQLDFVPEHHTDFIFSVIGEEFGFAGSIVIIALFGFLLLYVFEIMEHTTDLKARLLAIGIAAFLFFQVFVNIGMTIGLAPITGLTLPLVSYGGSSLVTTFFALGLLVSVYKERSIF
ncbi:MAG: rod shape-determining protein RodA [Omnitrophica bacterium RIFCSPLOWO2_12_FULL_50_11]|nr:MAG: rod shape-determining protein RodA [Omnitrophica bacterium RIFCSPLOWO2_12_FULL_50_11]